MLMGTLLPFYAGLTRPTALVRAHSCLDRCLDKCVSAQIFGQPWGVSYGTRINGPRAAAEGSFRVASAISPSRR